ncbi:MAG: DUF4236 domain-containing protein [Myxococcota bacterium]
MGSVRFWRRFKIAPGVTLNISKTGFSLSIGPKGAKYTIGTSGSRMTVGVPGTGLHYTHKFGTGGEAKKKEAKGAEETAAPDASTAIETPWIEVSDAEKEQFAAACDAAAAGDEATALEQLQGLTHLADAAFLAGLLRLRQEDGATAATSLLRLAYVDRSTMGQVFAQSERDLALDLPITDDVSVKLRPDPLGAALAYVEALQRLDRIDDGIAVLNEVDEQFPNHPLIAMSLEDLKAA